MIEREVEMRFLEDVRVVFCGSLEVVLVSGRVECYYYEECWFFLEELSLMFIVIVEFIVEIFYLESWVYYGKRGGGDVNVGLIIVKFLILVNFL